MNTSQLRCMINCDPILNEHVMGVFAADGLPKRTPAFPHGFIANTDPHGMTGHHWCAFYGDGKGHFEFFDSYGKPPHMNSFHFKRWLLGHAKTFQSNHVQLQSNDSDICGLYAILFLHQRLIGYEMEDIVNAFDNVHFEDNDAYVYSLMSNAFCDCCRE